MAAQTKRANPPIKSQEGMRKNGMTISNQLSTWDKRLRPSLEERVDRVNSIKGWREDVVVR
jgi:hypothetical protein